MPYLPRRLKGPLSAALRLFPAILVTGPRQSGKTTLLREELGADSAYVTFDDPLERENARTDPEGFLDRFGERRAILDEVQYVPELFQYLKLRIDRERDERGRWLLTGSQQFGLMANVGESLAGRIAILELLPLGIDELPEGERRDVERAVWLGGYPEPRLRSELRDLWMRSYVRTYVERDVRQLQNVRDLRAFETFVALCASRHGQELNMASLSREAGIAQPTVKAWVGALEAAYLVWLLPPYFASFGKRVVRSPKLYFLDPGLAATLTRQPTAEAALAGAMGGALFEGLVVAEAVKAFTHAGLRPELFFWRSQDGLEVDLLLPLGGRLVPVEVKSTATPTPRHARPLDRFSRLAGETAAEHGLLVCRVAEERPLPGGHLALPWWRLPGWIEERLGG
ncbi:MAG TPA: ATP-binding protein [Thermoanaerobaculia bacterium]|nr:ATP-binding protein [Thermoanaerobaculia bacterium]